MTSYTFLPLYFFLLALVVVVVSGQGTNTTYYPQYTPIDVPDNLLPTKRHGASCTRATLNVTNFALQGNLLYNASGEIDTVVCFGGYSRTFVPDGSQLEDTGGYVIGGVWHTYQLNDINLFDMANKRWYSLNYDDASVRKYNEGYFENGHPMGRGRSAIVVYNDKMFVFGGWTDQTILANTVLIYDFVHNNWTMLNYNESDTSVAPRARYGHTANLFNDKAYIFGGYWPIPRAPKFNFNGNVTTYPPDYFNDVWEFDLTTFKWTRLPSSNGPVPRAEHSTVLHGSELFVYGGNSYSSCAFDYSVPRNMCLTYTDNEDLWSYDLVSRTWTYVNASGTPAPARSSHGAGLNADGSYMLIFAGRTTGGIYKNDVQKYFFASNTWVNVGTSYPAAEPRFGHHVFAEQLGSSALSKDLFILTNGRNYLDNDLANYGELYAGPLLEIEPPPIDVETSTDKVVLSFDRKSPMQKLTPIDDCGDRVYGSAVTMNFASITEVSPSAAVVQRVDFQKSAYELNATIAAQNPAFNFGLNSTAGLQLALDFQLFGVQTLINYANETFLVDRSTNKWSFEVGGWRFLDTSNSLQIDVSISLANGRLFNRYSVSQDGDTRTKYTFFNSDIAFTAVISSRAELLFPQPDFTYKSEVISVDHRVVFVPGNPDYSQPLILFTFPYFGNGTVLRYDPNFGVTVEPDAQPSSDCGEFAGWKIAVIVVCTVIPLSLSCIAVMIMAGVYLFRRVRRPVNEEEMVAFDRHDSDSNSTDDFSPTHSSTEPEAASDSEV